MAHAQGTQGIKNAILAGIASIEHGVYLDDEAVGLMLQHDVYLVPTLVAPLAVVKYSGEHPDIVPPMMAAKAVAVVEDHRRSFRKAVEAGVKIAMGTDSGVGAHGENGEEVKLMVEYGMTPLQALHATTLQAARLLHMDHQIGSLSVGKLADIVLVEGNVADNIDALVDTANIKLVLKGGQAAKNLLDVAVEPIPGL